MGVSFFAHFLGTWMVPADETCCNTELVPFAAGSKGSCHAQGWLFYSFVWIGGLSNILLAVCYYLMAVKEMPDSTLEHPKWKAIFLGIPYLFGVCLGIPAAVMGTAIYLGGWSCQTALMQYLGLKYFTVGIQLLGLITIFWCMVRLSWHVYQAEKMMDRFAQASDETVNRTRTNQVSKQGIAYVVVYLVTWLPTAPALFRLFPGNEYNVFFACIFPLQGLLNAIVYFRPRYSTYRKRGKSRITALTTALNMSDLSLRLSGAFHTFTLGPRSSKQTETGASNASQVNTLTNATEGENGSTSRINKEDEADRNQGELELQPHNSPGWKDKA